MAHPGWRMFTCQGSIWYARRRIPRGSSSAASFLPTTSGDAGIDFFAEDSERRFLKMSRLDVPTKRDLDRMADAQLCEFLAKAV